MRTHQNGLKLGANPGASENLCLVAGRVQLVHLCLGVDLEHAQAGLVVRRFVLETVEVSLDCRDSAVPRSGLEVPLEFSGLKGDPQRTKVTLDKGGGGTNRPKN